MRKRPMSTSAALSILHCFRKQKPQPIVALVQEQCFSVIKQLSSIISMLLHIRDPNKININIIEKALKQTSTPVYFFFNYFIAPK